MSGLKKRALKRRRFSSAQKALEDVRIENEFFDDMKKKMYEQITEDKKWR